MDSALAIQGAPGWYGKLPTLGDFASRRLEASFIDPWDLWLGERLGGLRETQGDAWLQAYLDSPVWRFVLMAGCLAPTQAEPMAGVLMASVDRVGRYFPLTLVAPLARTPGDAHEIEALMAWLHRLEDVAVDALQDDWTIEQLDNALALMPPTLPPEPASHDDPLAPTRAALQRALAGESAFVPIEAVHGRAELAALLHDGVARQHASGGRHFASGRSFWLCDGDSGTQLLVAAGMPGQGEFMRMFGQADAASADADAMPPYHRPADHAE